MLKLFLSEFKCYRRKVGGKWYLLYEECGISGFAGGGVEYWSQTPPAEGQEIVVLKTEDYTILTQHPSLPEIPDN